MKMGSVFSQVEGGTEEGQCLPYWDVQGYFVQTDVISLSLYPGSQQHVLRSNKISGDDKEEC